MLNRPRRNQTGEALDPELMQIIWSVGEWERSIMQDESRIEQAERSIEHAEKNIEPAEKRIVAAKRRFNELAPIERLPSEILLEVFMYRSADWRNGNCSWIGVSHVCHRWRGTALESARFWSQLFASSYERTEELLSRSKQASLDVVIPGQAADDERRIQLVLDRLPRMRSFEWIMCYPSSDWVVPSSAPILHSVALHGEDDFEEYEGDPYIVPLMHLDTPKLAHLKILHTPSMLWKAKLFGPTLTHLTFRRRYTEDPFPQHPDCTVAEVLRVLGSMSSLDELDLANVLPPPQHLGPGPNRSVSFSKLRVLRLAAPASNLLCFLERTSFPAVVEVSFDFTDDEELNEDPMTRCLHLIASIITSSARPKDPIRPLRSLHYVKMKLEAWYLDHGVECLSGCRGCNRTCLSTPALVVQASEAHSGARAVLFQKICESLPLLHVGSAFLDINEIAENQWRAAYTSMPHLRELGVTGCYSYHESLVESLSTMRAIPSDDPLYSLNCRLTRYIFPSLEVLLVHSLHLPPPGALTLGEAPHILYGYGKVLQDRGDAGHRLFSLLLLDGQGIYQLDVDILEGAAKMVYCNRVEPTPPAQDKDKQASDIDDDSRAAEPAKPPDPKLGDDIAGEDRLALVPSAQSPVLGLVESGEIPLLSPLVSAIRTTAGSPTPVPPMPATGDCNACAPPVPRPLSPSPQLRLDSPWSCTFDESEVNSQAGVYNSRQHVEPDQLQKDLTLPPLVRPSPPRSIPQSEISYAYGTPLCIPPPFTLQPRPLWDPALFSPFSRPSSQALRCTPNEPPVPMLQYPHAMHALPESNNSYASEPPAPYWNIMPSAGGTARLTPHPQMNTQPIFQNLQPLHVPQQPDTVMQGPPPAIPGFNLSSELDAWAFGQDDMMGFGGLDFGDFADWLNVTPNSCER